MSTDRDRGEGLIGPAVYGAMTTGTIAGAFTILSVFIGNWESAGIGLVAAAVAFGLLANALLRR